MGGDPEIRAALLARLRTTTPNALLVQEWRVDHWPTGTGVLDVATVTDGAIAGYEIKSEVDSRARLAGQVQIYGAVCDRAWLVAVERHLRHARSTLPPAWGLVAWDGALHVEREAEPQLGRDPRALASLLWKPECMALAVEHGFTASRSAYKDRYVAMLVEGLTIDALAADVRRVLRGRRNWRTADGRNLELQQIRDRVPRRERVEATAGIAPPPRGATARHAPDPQPVKQIPLFGT